jgi:hypothetical protein
MRLGGPISYRSSQPNWTRRAPQLTRTLVVVVANGALVLTVLLRRRVESGHLGHIAASTALRTRRRNQAARASKCPRDAQGRRPGAWQRGHSSERGLRAHSHPGAASPAYAQPRNIFEERRDRPALPTPPGFCCWRPVGGPRPDASPPKHIPRGCERDRCSCLRSP